MAFEYLFSNEQYKAGHTKDWKSFKSTNDGASLFYQKQYKSRFSWGTFNISETEKFRNYCKPEYSESFFQVKKIPDGNSFLEKEYPEIAKEMIQKMNSDEGFQTYLSSWTRYHHFTKQADILKVQLDANKQLVNHIKEDIEKFENGTPIVKFHRNWFQQKFAWSRFKENKYIKTLRNSLATSEEKIKRNTNYISRMEKNIKQSGDYILKYERDNKPFFNKLEITYKHFVIKTVPTMFIKFVNKRIPTREIPALDEDRKHGIFNDKNTQEMEPWEKSMANKLIKQDEEWKAEKAAKEAETQKMTPLQQAIQKQQENEMKQIFPDLQQPKFTMSGGLK